MKTLKAVSILIAVAAIGITAVSTPVMAGDREQSLIGDSRFSLGMNASYAIPTGAAGDATDFNDLTTGSVPIQLDLNYRFHPNWQAGVYFAYGPTMIADKAKDTLAAAGLTDISGHREQRVGAQVMCNCRPEDRIVPWLGAGLGFSWTRYASAKTAAGKETEIGLAGLDGSLQIGADYKTSSRFSVGPFASVHVGQFWSHVNSLEGSDEKWTDVSDEGIHEWFQFGVRTTFGL